MTHGEPCQCWLGRDWSALTSSRKPLTECLAHLRSFHSCSTLLVNRGSEDTPTAVLNSAYRDLIADCQI
jgi:hypothetical protein